MAVLVIDARYNGPPDSANGGYAAGSLASHVPVHGPVEVTLLRPPPLGRALSVLRTEGADVELRDGEDVVARARPGALDDAAPPALPGVEAARAAAARSPIRDGHPFPTCFACGPERTDGLGVLTGPLEDGSAWAAAWTPEDDAPTLVWAALDCSSAGPVSDRTDRRRPIVLGRITAAIGRPVAPGAPHAVVAWELGREGRKRFSASAVLDATGAVRAQARCTWIELR